MTTHPDHDALATPRVAADLCGVPTRMVLNFVEAGTVALVPIRALRLVSLRAVERAIEAASPVTLAGWAERGTE